jgi:hypothetical protein
MPGSCPAIREPGKGNPGSGGHLTGVTVMQSAQPWPGDDVALVWRFDGAGGRTILVEEPVSPIFMVISSIIRENLVEVLRIEDNEVVQTLAANRTNQSFDHGILPG